MSVGRDALTEWALKPITLTRAYRNSFEVKPGVMRHDVLVEIKEVAEVDASRENLLRSRYPDHDKFFMRDPHVTYKICDTTEEAEAICEALNVILPYAVTVTGVTID